MIRRVAWSLLYGAIGAAAALAAKRLAAVIWRVATGETPPPKRR